MKSYDYAHRFGVRQISWDDFASLAKHLAELVVPFHPQLILGGGTRRFIPGHSSGLQPAM